MPTFTLAELANLTNCQMDGEYDCAVHSVASLPSAQTGQLAFLNTKDFRQYLPDTKASAVILKPGDAKNCPCNALITSNPSLAYAKAAEALHPLPKKSPGIHPSAVIGSATSIDPSVAIGPHCTIGDKVVIEAGVNIGPNCIIEDHCHIQQDSRLLANVTLLNQTRLGQRCLIHSGAVIGSDGFGLADDDGKWVKIPQLGRVVLGNDVEVGAGAAIDRGALDDTILADGVKLDNQVHIAHNVRIGEHTAIAAGVGIAGSSIIGAHCMVAGMCGINGHIELADHVHISGMTAVTRSIQQAGRYTGTIPIMSHRTWRKNFIRLKQLDDITRRLEKLENSSS